MRGKRMKSDISGVVCALATRCAERTISVHYVRPGEYGMARQCSSIGAQQPADASDPMSSMLHPFFHPQRTVLCRQVYAIFPSPS